MNTLAEKELLKVTIHCVLLTQFRNQNEKNPMLCNDAKSRPRHKGVGGAGKDRGRKIGPTRSPYALSAELLKKSG